MLQEAHSSHADAAMETDWPAIAQKIKRSPSSYNLFDNGGNPPGVDELLSQATDFMANSSTLSLSDGRLRQGL